MKQELPGESIISEDLTPALTFSLNFQNDSAIVTILGSIFMGMAKGELKKTMCRCSDS